jgi:hypothetical protein
MLSIQTDRTSKRSSRKESHRAEGSRRTSEKESHDRPRESDRRRKEREGSENDVRDSEKVCVHCHPIPLVYAVC